jgi:phage-related protein
VNADRILALKLVGDVSSINKSMKQTQGRMRSFGASAGSWMKAAGIGLAIEGVSKLGDALGDAWAGFREGEKASAQLGTSWGNLNVKGADLQGTIDEISALTLKLGTDDTEAINAFNTALQATGGKPAQAMGRLRLAQDLVANGSAPNLQAALKLVQGAVNGSAKVVDRFGLKGKTAADRLDELRKKVQGAAAAAAKSDPIRVALNGIGEGLETFVGALSKGDLQGALAGVQAIGATLAAAWTAVFPAIDKAMTALIGEDNWNNAKALAQGFLDSMATIFAKLGVIWDGLAPHVQNALALIAPVVGAIGTIVGLMGENIKLVLDAIGDLLSGDFAGAWASVQGIIGNAVEAGKALLNGMLAFLQGLAPGILAAAQGIGDAIFQGIVIAISGLAETVRALVNQAVEALRSVWNGLDFYIPPFEVPGIPKVIVPDPLGGSGFEVFGGIGPTRIWSGSGDLIPDLAKGGVIMPTPGGTLARIGEAGKPEAVIPLDRMGDFGGGATYNIVVNVAPGGDLAETGRRIVQAIRAYERGDGKVWRTA